MFSMDFKFEIASLISKELKCKKEEVIEVLEVPPESNLGDYAFPCFIFAKELNMNPHQDYFLQYLIFLMPSTKKLFLFDNN